MEEKKKSTLKKKKVKIIDNRAADAIIDHTDEDIKEEYDLLNNSGAYKQDIDQYT